MIANAIHDRQNYAEIPWESKRSTSLNCHLYKEKFNFAFEMNLVKVPDYVTHNF